MYYVRDDENIAAEIKQLIFKRAGKPSESVLGRLLLYTGILAVSYTHLTLPTT